MVQDPYSDDIHLTVTKELKQRLLRRQRQPQKTNRFRFAMQQLCTCVTLFWHFSAVNAQLRREDTQFRVNIRQRLSLSFPELRYSFEFNSNLPTFDEVWSTAGSLFKWRFCRCRRSCCRVSSLVSAWLTAGCYTYIVSPKRRLRIKWNWFVRKEKREGVRFPRSSHCFLFVCKLKLHY